jgi:opacity protein-like surface antigen
MEKTIFPFVRGTMRKAALLAAAVALFGVGLPAAEGWFAGADLGYVRCTFRPHYTFVSSSATPDQYVDRGNGVEAALVFGREWTITPRFAIQAQARASAATAKWELDLTGEETSHIRYEMGGALALSILPALRVRPGLWIQGEAGWGMSHLRERKTSLDNTSYAYDEWVGSGIVGAGLRYELTRGFELTVNYRYRKIRSFTYKSYLADGTHWETITDNPSSHTITGGIRFRF